ncbi:seven-hairpin glycosidase [Auriculariales sp. MPI-PUGE-AT-0066]|nr:seven-hairpin glycosidase [Auriculariales sp. MPI-PUGE-AT-0066]
MHVLCPTIAAAVLALPVVQAGSIQKSGLTVPAKYAAQRDVVKQIFTDSWSAYQQFAFGTMRSTYSSDLYQVARNHTINVDFSSSKTGGTVSVFETTIRYLGGLLSAYELTGKTDTVLLDKAKQLGDKLAFAWVGSNVLPYPALNFSSNSASASNTNIAEAGTLVLEWGRLSEYTGDTKYKTLAEKAMSAIASRTDTLLPGLAGQGVQPATGAFSNKYISWGGASDSYFEYLIKYARQTNNANQLWVKTWRTAVDSTLRSLAKVHTLDSPRYIRTTVGNWLMIADMDTSSRLRHVGSHLQCFHGGNFIMGGKLLDNDTIVQAGIRMTDACVNTYASTATGIGPEGFAWVSADGNEGPSAAQTAFNNIHGFYVTDGSYDLRPEVMESNFYAWRATGNVQYLDNAAAFLEAANARLRVSATGGYAVLNDVQNTASSQRDRTESFWFAETLKYLYLTFDDPSRYSLDNYVFNTEAHPLIAPTALATYNV